MVKLFKNILRTIAKLITLPVFILFLSVLIPIYFLFSKEGILDLIQDLYQNFFNRFEEKG